MEYVNKIICGDCLEVLAQFPEESVDLIYLDPPFFTKKDYAVIWGNHLELREYSDRWIVNNENHKKATKSIDVYLEWIEPRLRACHRVLKPTGSMFLHCDWHANAYLRLLMDGVFGMKNFKNEIIWHYRRWSGATKHLQRMHDMILFFAKSQKHTFNVMFQPYSDPDFIEDTVRGMVDGKLVRLKDENGEYIKREKENKGVPFHDVWHDINFLGPTSKERIGYPTQKPQALIERIIEVGSNKGDLVLDPMVGGGTTIAAAKHLKRRWIGIDVSPIACQVSARRIGLTKWKILGYKPLLEELKRLNPADFQQWIVYRIGGIPNPQTTGDMGVDGYFQGDPVQVKRSSGVGRNVVDNFETAIRRQGKDRGTIIAFNFTPGAKGEVARAKRQEEIDIELIDIKRLLELGIIREKTEKELELEQKRKVKPLNDYHEE